MSAQDPSGDPGSGGGEPTEEELRAAYEAEVKKIRVEQILLEQVVTLVNLGMRRTGLAPGTEDERDAGQVRLAIEAVRALLPLLEQTAAPQAGQIRDALSQLQLAFLKLGGASAPEQPGPEPGASGPRAPGPDAPGPDAPGTDAPETGGDGEAGTAPSPASEPDKAEEPGPAQRSGRLWIPGQ
jgi:hypothetical protein